MPSTDAVTRGRIANLPPEVSNAEGVEALCIDSDVSRDLQNKIKAALELLKSYNGKLDTELEDRKKVSMKLQDLIYFQKDLLTQAEHRLEVSEFKKKLMFGYQETYQILSSRNTNSTEKSSGRS